jgi:hypothetical protein
MDETRYPLCWPANWKRTEPAHRIRAQFGRVRQQYRDGAPSYTTKDRLSISDSLNRISGELERFGVAEETVIVSTNLPTNIQGVPRGDRGEPHDPGVAVYWTLKGKKQCMAIDRYDRVADNLAGVSATLEALRAVERHGGGAILDRAFVGFAALPAPTVPHRTWREVFGVGLNDHLNRDAIETRFRALAGRFHPDIGGTHDQMAELNAARAEALHEVKS